MSGEEYDSSMDYSDDDSCYESYYNHKEDYDAEQMDPSKSDPEFFAFDCLTVEEVERLLNECVKTLSNALQITPSLAKVLLHTHEWTIPTIVTAYREDSSKLLVLSKIKPAHSPPVSSYNHLQYQLCPVCVATLSSDRFCSLPCGHPFCKDCWAMHFEVQINQGMSYGIGCMAKGCDILAQEEFVLQILNRPNTRVKYQQFALEEHINSHPQLRFCPGPNCQIVVRAKDPLAKRVTCKKCESSFCFLCRADYHAPTDCGNIKRWLTTCQLITDSETANYIRAHTKGCPQCHASIEKDGGCNRMQCFICKHVFCWVCLGDWNTHKVPYECSRHKENPNIAVVLENSLAQESTLKKFQHYFDRWENHSNSLRLEKQTLQKIQTRIERNVMDSATTWVDWQSLLNAAALLAKCRYTIKYTYPDAYYMDDGPRKDLFEYQQAQLEAEIENLSWRVERAERTDRGDVENQMDIAEKRRRALLKEFL